MYRRRLASYLIVAVALTCLVAAAMPSFAWDYAADFSIANGNPNGLWSYGRKPAGELNGAFTAYVKAEDWGSQATPLPLWRDNTDNVWEHGLCIRNNSDSGPWAYIPAGEAGVHPGWAGYMAAIRWTSPFTGSVQIDARFTGLVPDNDPTGTTTAVHVVKGSSSLFDAEIQGFIGTAPDYYDQFGASPEQVFSQVVTVSAGETIDFLVDKAAADANTDYDMTGVAATITDLDTPGTVSGTVYANAPRSPRIPGAVVSTLDGAYSTVADENGDYSLTMHYGTFTLRASKLGYNPQELESNVSAGGETTLDFHLDAGVVTGVVTSSTTGDPVAGATVAAKDLGTSTTTDSAGMYSITLPPGDHSITYSRPGFQKLTLTVTATAGAEVTKDVALDPRDTFDVVADFVSDSNPNDVWTYGVKYDGDLSAPIVAYGVHEAWGMLNVWRDSPPTNVWEHGFFGVNTGTETVNWVEPGKAAFHPGWNPFMTMATVRWTAPFTTKVRVEAHFSGLVPDNTPTGTTTTVHVVYNGGSLFDAPIQGYVGSAANGYSDGFGDNRTQDYAGVVDVTEGDFIDFVVDCGSNFTTDYDMTGLAATISPDYEPGVVTGTVYANLPGHPTVAGAVVATPDGTTSATTGSDGHYSLSLRPGTRTLKASKYGYDTDTAEVVVLAGKEVEQDFTLDAAILNGTVSYVSGTPVEGAVVRDVGGEYVTTTAADGSYSITMPPGDYTVRASKAGYAPALATVSLAVETETTQDFTLAPPATIHSDLATDFSIVDGNPNCLWTYGTKPFGDPTGALTAYGVAVGGSTVHWWRDNPPENVWQRGMCLKNCGTAMSYWLEPGQVGMHPGWDPVLATARWTAPCEADVMVNAVFTGVVSDNSPTGTTDDVHVVVNGVSLFDGEVLGFIGTAANGYTDAFGDAPRQAFTGVVHVQANDTIDFVVGLGSDAVNDYGMTAVAASIDGCTDAQSIADLRDKADGDFVRLASPTVATASSQTFTDGSFYIEDPNRTCGIKIVPASEALPSVDLGDRLIVVGILDVDENGERVIRATSITKVSAGDSLNPLGMTNKTMSSASASPVGLLGKVWGKVVEKTDDYMIVDDGSGTPVRVILSGVATAINADPPGGTSKAIAVAGLIGKAVVGDAQVVVIRPRGDSDIRFF